MYAEFFGFRELPFNNTPDPRFFYSTPDHEEALASLIYGVRERKGFVLLTGEVGAGKTLVTRLMLRHFGTHIAFATINHAVQTPDDLMESICTEFEVPFEAGAGSTQLIRKLHDFLLAQFAQDIRVVLVLDEAQNLPAEGFEQLRMIGNLEADDAKLLQTAIVGQPELQQLFLSPALRQLRQRIYRAFHLPALSREATQGYIHYRLSVVTDDAAGIFDSSAIEAIYDFSRGVPRIINTVCDNSLLSAYSADRHTVDGPFVKSVIAQMMVVGDPRCDSRYEDNALVPPRSHASPVPAPPASCTIAGEGLPRRAASTRAGTQSDPLVRSIETMARRIENIEACFRGRPRTRRPQMPAPVEESFGPDAPPRLTSDETLPVDRDARLRIDEVTRRVTGLERRLSRSQLSDLTEARALRTSLEHLVRQARSLVARAENSSDDLKRRDGQLGKLAANIKSVTRDLRRLLDRARETTAKNNQAQRNARAIHDRLVAQSERSRGLADNLTRIAHRLTPQNTATAADAVLLKEGSLHVDSLPTPRDGTVPPTSPTGHAERALADTRESLSELRTLARGTCGGGGATVIEDASTARLADQVEGLLEMIDSGADTQAD